MDAKIFIIRIIIRLIRMCGGDGRWKMRFMDTFVDVFQDLKLDDIWSGF